MISTHSLPEENTDISANSGWIQFWHTLTLSFWKNKNIAITALVLMMVTLPILFLLNINQYYGIQEGLTRLVALLMIPISIIFVVISSAQMFSYLHNRAALDVYHALPIRRLSLFAGRFLAGYLLVLIPQIITFATVIAIGVMLSVPVLPVIGTALTVFLLTLAVHAVSCLAFVLTGTLFDALFLMLLLNIAYPLTTLACQYLADRILPGYSMNMFGYNADSNLNQLLMLSPIGQLFSSAIYTLNAFQVVWWVGLTIAIIAGSFLIYRCRKTEKAGLPYAYRSPFIVLRFLGSFVVGVALGAVFYSSNTGGFNFILGVMIGSFTTHLIIEVMLSRGFSGFRRSLICYAVFIVVFMIGLTSLTYGFFGYDTRLPAKDQIVEAQIGSGELTSTTLYDGTVIRPTFTDPENVAIVYNIHQAWLTEMQNNISKPYSLDTRNQLYRNDGGNDVNMPIYYKLNTGSEFQREVYFDATQEPYASLLKKLETSAEYSLQPYRNIFDLDSQLTSVYLTTKTQISVSIARQGEKNKLAEIQTALQEDLRAGAQKMTAENILCTLHVESGHEDNPNFSTYTFVKLTKAFTQTLAILNKYDVMQQVETLDDRYTSAYVVVNPTKSDYLNSLLSNHYPYDPYSSYQYYSDGYNASPRLTDDQTFFKIDHFDTVQSMLDVSQNDWDRDEKGYLVLFAFRGQVNESGLPTSPIFVLFLPESKLPPEVAAQLNP